MRVEQYVRHGLLGFRGRLREVPVALARAFLAKAVFDITTTRSRIARLEHDRTLRRLCDGEATARRAVGLAFPKNVRYCARTTIERLYARLKDEFGGRHVRVRVATRCLDTTACSAFWR